MKIAFGLRPRLLMVVLLSVLPALGLIVTDTIESYRRAVTRAEKSALQWAEFVTNYHNDIQRQTRMLVSLLARDPAVRSADHAACNRHMESLLREVTEGDSFFNFVAIDLDGSIACSARQGSPGNRDVRDRPYFWDVLTSRKIVTGEYVFGKIIHAPIIPVAGPIFNDGGELRGVMLVTINLAWIAKTMAPRLPPGAVLRLSDANGTVLVQLPDHHAGVGHGEPLLARIRAAEDRSAFAAQDEDGIERLFAHSRVAYGDHVFNLVLGFPKDQAYAEAEAGLMRAVLALLAVVLVGMLTAWEYGNAFIVSGIWRLKTAARDMAAGNLATRVALQQSDEIGSLAVAFNDMAAALQANTEAAERREQALDAALVEANKATVARGKFLAAASHDLRQPLQSLILLVHALEYRLAGHPAEGIVATMLTALDTFKSLLDALLDLSKLDAGLVKPELQPVSVADIVQELATAYQPRMAAKGLRFKARACPQWVESDRVLLHRILSNLLDNAVKYTASGGVLLLARQQGTAIRIEVVDTGIGISPDQHGEIFDEFVQLGEAGRERSQGMGLGLAMVKRLADLLGHELAVRSRPGRGSRFSVTLRQVLPEPLPLANPCQPKPRSLCRVLAVDDDPLILEGLRVMLQGLGFQVMTAQGQADAMDLLDRTPPDIVVADYRLGGGVTGVDVILAARQRLGQRLPAVIMTGNTAVETAPNLTVLHKPVVAAVLLRTISDLIGDSAASLPEETEPG